MKYQLLFILLTVVFGNHCLKKGGDEGRPYEFGFTIDGQQHRHEKKDDNGIIQGEFGFITADGVYHVTVYATDENGNFKILSMRNIKVSGRLDEPGAKLPVIPGQNPASTTQQPTTKLVTLPPTTLAQITTGRPVYKFTTAPTIGPGCSGCGIIASTKPPPRGATTKFPFQNPAFQQPQVAPVANIDEEPPTNQINTFNQANIPGNQNRFPDALNSAVQPDVPAVNQGVNNFNPTVANIGVINQNQGPSTFNQNQGFVPTHGNIGSINQHQGLLGPSTFSQNQNSANPPSSGYNDNLQTIEQNFESNIPQEPVQPPPSSLSQLTVNNGVIDVPGNNPIAIKDKYPNMSDGLPEGIDEKDITDLLYKFKYTVGFHGHYEKGLKNGAKVGGYFVNGRDGISRIVTYVADELGYRPKVKFINLGLDSPDTPKEATEKTFGLKEFEFVWYPIK